MDIIIGGHSHTLLTEPVMVAGISIVRYQDLVQCFPYNDEVYPFSRG